LGTLVPVLIQDADIYDLFGRIATATDLFEYNALEPESLERNRTLEQRQAAVMTT
jgi:hypothetical protein